MYNCNKKNNCTFYKNDNLSVNVVYEWVWVSGATAVIRWVCLCACWVNVPSGRGPASQMGLFASVQKLDLVWDQKGEQLLENKQALSNTSIYPPVNTNRSRFTARCLWYTHTELKWMKCLLTLVAKHAGHLRCTETEPRGLFSRLLTINGRIGWKFARLLFPE